MSKALGMRCVWGFCGVLASVLLLFSTARAEVSSDLSGSILVYPKVVWDSGRDTVIQLSNTGNNLVHAHCFYVNAQTFQGVPRWQVTDFHLWLTRQQPVHWVASRGRPVDPTDNTIPPSDGSGLDPGAIPPVPPDFVGELKCVQVDASGNPFGGNELKGEALLRDSDGDVSKYNAVAILANPELNNDPPERELRLDNTEFNDGEYNSCPNSWLLNHFTDGAPSEVVQTFTPSLCVDDEDCPIRTMLTLVPCKEDFENLIPSQVTVQFEVVNEFEETFSTSTTVDCWLTTRLADIDVGTGTCTGDGESCQSDDDCINNANGFCSKNSVFSFGVTGTPSAFTTITPVDQDGGVIAVAEESHFTSIDDVQLGGAWAAWNPQHSGTRFEATGGVVDTITIPSSF